MQASTKVLEVGDLFTSTPDLESIVVVHETEVLGLVLRRDFMNLYASLYGKELYGKQPVLRFMNRNIMQVDKKLPLEEASYRLTTSLDIHTDEFIILDDCRLAGKGRLIDLLHEITKLQVNRARHANPLTLLPGNVPIQQQLQKLFRQNTAFAVCYFDLDHFKPFNDFFGFSRGDKVLRFVSELLVANIDDKSDFIGHIGGDDFVAIFRSANWQATVRTNPAAVRRQHRRSLQRPYRLRDHGHRPGRCGTAIRPDDPVRWRGGGQSVGVALPHRSFGRGVDRQTSCQGHAGQHALHS